LGFLSDTSGTVEVTTVDRDPSECAETTADDSGEATDPSAAAGAPVRVRWLELAILAAVLAVIIAVSRGIQDLLGI
jgi:hypothetical protein